MSNSTQLNINIPVHVAIIPDGNRRWATSKGLPATMGHKKGSEIFDSIVTKSRELGIKCLSTWAFSTENWKRPDEEKDFLFNLCRELTKNYRKKCIDEKIRFIHLGRKDRLPSDIVDSIKQTEEETKQFVDFTVAIGIDYGGRDELLRAITLLNESNLEVNKENLEKFLDTKNMPDVDLIIRTGGEQRLSGFMPWQSEYAEYSFPSIFFPDLTPEILENIITEFSNRDRRFGGNSSAKV